MTDQSFGCGLFYSFTISIYRQLLQLKLMASHSEAKRTAGQAVKPPQLFWLKLVMLLGIALILIGHYLWVGLDLPQTMGVPGIILVAACCAIGLALSLPTKIYLTLLLMQHESDVKAAERAIARKKDSQDNSQAQQRVTKI